VRKFLTHTLQDEIVRAATNQRMATMAEQRIFVAAGGLMSYDATFPEVVRRAATKSMRSWTGQSSEMPIQLATEFDLVINLGTAGALGIQIRALSSCLPTR
jgi:putative tryptophan/tyrosine transport system substrate-binding protein